MGGEISRAGGRPTTGGRGAARGTGGAMSPSPQKCPRYLWVRLVEAGGGGGGKGEAIELQREEWEEEEDTCQGAPAKVNLRNSTFRVFSRPRGGEST